MRAEAKYSFIIFKLGYLFRCSLSRKLQTKVVSGEGEAAMQYIIIRKSIFFIFSTSSFYHMSPDVQHLRQFMTKLFGPIVNNIYRRDDGAGVETTKDISFSYFRLYPINCTDLAVISFHVTFQLHKTSQTKKVFLADRCSQAFNCVSLKS